MRGIDAVLIDLGILLARPLGDITPLAVSHGLGRHKIDVAIFRRSLRFVDRPGITMTKVSVASRRHVDLFALIKLVGYGTTVIGSRTEALH